MAHWSRPPDLHELQELERDRPRRAVPQWQWLAVAGLGGVLLTAVLEFGTDLFDSGPTELEVSTAYREAYDRAVTERETYWQEALDDAWWDGYREGDAESAAESPTLSEGLSWDGGFAAGLRWPEINVDRRYWEGWMDGFNDARASVEIEATARPRSDNAEALEPGGEP